MRGKGLEFNYIFNIWVTSNIHIAEIERLHDILSKSDESLGYNMNDVAVCI